MYNTSTGFPAHFSPRPFTRESIEILTPGQDGVYGIYTSDMVLVYVGRGDIRERLRCHVNGDNRLILQCQPKWWIAIVTEDHINFEKQMITRFRPVCNQRVG